MKWKGENKGNFMYWKYLSTNSSVQRHLKRKEREKKLHTLLRMISGARYSGVPHNVQVLPFTLLANPKSVTFKSEVHVLKYSIHVLNVNSQDTAELDIHSLCCGSPECSRGGRWEDSLVSDLCIWDLVNGGTQTSALFEQHKIVHVVHWKGRRDKRVNRQKKNV